MPQKYIYSKPKEGFVALDGALDKASSPYPLLVFSHGYGGSGLGNTFLAEELASRGWIVAAADHNDKDSAMRIRTGRNKNIDRRDL